MSLSMVTVWCDECERQFGVPSTDTITRICPTCSGVDAPPPDDGIHSGPLTEEEMATTIEVDVTLPFATATIRHKGYSPKEWRELLKAAEAGGLDDLHDLGCSYLLDEYEVETSVRRPKGKR